MTPRIGHGILYTDRPSEDKRSEFIALLTENARQCGVENPEIIYERVSDLVSKCYWRVDE